MKRSILAQRKQSNGPEHISRPLDRVLKGLSLPVPAEWLIYSVLPPELVDMVHSRLCEALEKSADDVEALRQAMGECVEMLEGQWPSEPELSRLRKLARGEEA